MAISPTTVTAEPGAPALPGIEVIECAEVLHACDRALQGQRRVVRELESELDMLLRQKRSAEQEAQKLREEKNAWYRDPLTMFLFGAIVGIVGVSR